MQTDLKSPGCLSEREAVLGGNPRKKRVARFSALPLWSQIVGWFFLNLVLLGGVVALLLTTEFQSVLGAILEGKAAHRLSALSGEVTEALSSRSRDEWDDVMASMADNYGVQFALFREDGAWMAGQIGHPPASVVARLRVGRGRPPENQFILGMRPPPPPPGARHFVLKEEGMYWIGVRLNEGSDERGQRGPAMLLLASPHVSAGGLLLEFTPWWIAGAALLGSALFWIPLVRRITVSLGKMRDAAEQMAAGKFEVRVAIGGRDELGNLGESLNDLGGQLGDFVNGQKRFLGDIAHELCSPVARMEWSLGVLEQKAGAALREEVQDVREEVVQLSRLIEELLCFTKAGMQEGIHPEWWLLRELVEDAAHQEGVPTVVLKNSIPEELALFVDRKLFQRAVANVLRNALRYSGGTLPIEVEGRREQGFLSVTISDEGPGVPDDILHRLCEPFFRPETARTRETGGTGLGLAIVKRSIEACDGVVRIRNRQPHGLTVEFVMNCRGERPSS